MQIQVSVVKVDKLFTLDFIKGLVVHNYVFVRMDAKCTTNEVVYII